MKTVGLQNWRFTLEKGLKDTIKDPWAPDFNDSLWDAVIVPHDWAVTFPFDVKWSSGTGYLPGGTGWYRTVFNVPEHWDGKQAFVCFDGVYKNSRVWCNGYYLGYRPNGYIGLRYDLSHCLRSGDNVIAVKVSHEDFADSRWYTGSGIYRKACVRFCDHIDIDDSALAVHSEYRDGVAVVRASGEIIGDLAGKSVLLTAFLEGKNGSVYKTETSISPINGPVPFEITVRAANPDLWSPETPNLYKLRFELREEPDGAAFPGPSVAVGIRSFRFDPDYGFFLNEKSFKIKGVCVHHDAGCLGAAVWPDVWRRRLLKLKDMGCNAIRTSHNPHMSELYDLCDEMGFLVMDEAFDEWEGCKNKWARGHNIYPPLHQGYAEDFSEWHERDLADMVIRDRNHPSVIMWSIGNEVDYPNDPYVHPLFAEMTGNNDANKPKAEMMYSPDKPDMKRLAQVAPKLVSIIRKHDTSRPVLFAAAFPELSSRLGIFDALDMIGYNYKEQFYEEDHKRFPKLPILGSENSHSISAWRSVQKNEYISGQFLWTGIDYLGEAHGWPFRASGAGLLDLAGNEKTAYFRRKVLWTDKPFLYLFSRPQNEEPEPNGETSPWKLFRSWDYVPGQQVEVICYTNIGRAELFSNGKSCGIENLNDEYGYIRWVVPFERGTLKVTGLDSDNGIGDSVESTLPPARLRLSEWKTAARQEGKYRIAQVEAEMLDEADRLCVHANHTLTVSLKGDGKFLGMENGDLADCIEYASRRRSLYHGKLIIYALLNCETDKPVSFTATVDGLSPVTITIEA